MKVKNRAPNPIQITAEQLLREAKERGLEEVKAPPETYITDKEELLNYQQTKRKDFEDQLRRNKHNFGVWMRYGLWEASQKDFDRARSVFERAIDVDYRNSATWFKYAEMEMKNKFINHARNVWDRCVTYFPRIDAYWYKYTYMEEMVGAVEQARQVFERWLKWEPEDLVWHAFVKFEMRQGEVENAKGVFERLLIVRPTNKAYLKYAKWAESQGDSELSRAVYERAMVELHDQEPREKVLVNFARFEMRCKEHDRARVIFKYALERVSQEKGSGDKIAQQLKQEYIAFEKKYGDKKGIEDAILENRRAHYEALLAGDKYNYDGWFDYVRLEESEGLDLARTREVYERAIANYPPIKEKRYWKRYIYLWIYYALFEELQAKDLGRARDVYKACIALMPNGEFTFGKIWLMAAHLEVRRGDLGAARKLLGAGLGMCGKENIFKGYIELELQLGEIDRCRNIYAKYLETMPFNCQAWSGFATLEASVGEVPRARAIYEVAINQPALDLPELLWKSYIDFEISEQETENARGLYERLLERTKHVKVWISYAKFEALEALGGAAEADSSSKEPVRGDVRVARGIFQKAYSLLKEQQLKEERVLLLNAWRDCEASCPGGDVSVVEGKLPRKMKMKRLLRGDDGAELGWEEYFDYQFPDDDKKLAGLKILENALKWKQMQAAAGADEGVVQAPEETSRDGSGEAGSKRKLDTAEIDIDDVQ